MNYTRIFFLLGMIFFVVPIYSMHTPMKKTMGASFAIGGLTLGQAAINYVACKIDPAKIDLLDVSKLATIDQVSSEVAVTTAFTALLTAPFFYGFDIRDKVLDLEDQKTMYRYRLEDKYRDACLNLKEVQTFNFVDEEKQWQRVMNELIVSNYIMEKQATGLRLSRFNEVHGVKLYNFNAHHVDFQRTLLSSGTLPICIIPSTTILGCYFNSPELVGAGIVASYITLGIAGLMHKIQKKKFEDFTEQFEKEYSDEIYKQDPSFNKGVEAELVSILDKPVVKVIEKQNGIVENARHKMRSSKK